MKMYKNHQEPENFDKHVSSFLSIFHLQMIKLHQVFGRLQA